MRIDKARRKFLTLVCLGCLANFGCDSPEIGDLNPMPAKPVVLVNGDKEPQTELKAKGETCLNEQEELVLFDSSRLYRPEPKVEIDPDNALDEVLLSDESFSIECHFPVPGLCP